MMFNTRRRCDWKKLYLDRLSLAALLAVSLSTATLALDIQLPPETTAFKQDSGAEIANAQCLICHSVEYVTMQPPMPLPFWKSSIQKMQQKYGAPIPDADVAALAEYLARNYGVFTNQASARSSPQPQPAQASAGKDGPQVAARYGCLGCHNPTQKIIGPSYRDIAAKYNSDPEAPSKIEEQIHQGGSGKWGPIIMPPFPQVSPADTKILADWILRLK
jgi:cytochrome c551/c552